MSIYNHTPGPWTVSKGHGVYEISSPDFLVSEVYIGDECSEADAQLIAAAPDLLDSLLEIVAINDLFDVKDRTIPAHYPFANMEAKLAFSIVFLNAKKSIDKAIGTTESLGDDPHNARNLADEEGGNNG